MAAHRWLRRVARRDASARHVRCVLDQLAATDLRPSPAVDALFRELVGTAGTLGGRSAAVRSRAVVRRCREVSARGEALLETHWARRVADGSVRVDDFPYARHYGDLVAWEHGVVGEALGRRPRSVVVAGSGPLPLTALELRRLDPDLAVTCLDTDATALATSREVADAVAGHEHGLHFVHGDAADHDYTGTDVVVLAALVGDTPRAKATVLAQACRTLADRSLVAARSVPRDGRQLLYPRVAAAAVPRGLDVLGERHPPAGVVNSVLLLRRRA